MVAQQDVHPPPTETSPLLCNGSDKASTTETVAISPFNSGVNQKYGESQGASAEWETRGKLKVLLLMSDTGGGHRASAQALAAAFEAVCGSEVSVSIVDLWVEIAGWPFSTYPAWYRFVARYPSLWLAVYWYAKFPPTRWFQEQMWQVSCHHKLKKYMLEHEPDIVISVHPMVNKLTQNVFRTMRAIDKVPSPLFMTVVTDYGDAHPMWFHKDCEAIYCPSEPVREIGRKLGIAERKLRLFGLPLRKEFWKPSLDKFEMRRKLGMDLDKPAALLMGGGDGMGSIDIIAKTLASQLVQDQGENCAQLVVVCGRNASVQSELEKYSWPLPVRCEGFVSNISEWMDACDLIITKAGPGTIAEAFIKGLPIIISSFLPGQEEGNMRFVVDNDLGKYSSDPKEIARIGSQWLGDLETLADMRTRAIQFGMPSASLDIVRDIGQVYNVEVVRMRNRLGLPNEVDAENREAFHRAFFIAASVLITMILVYLFLTKLILS